MYAPQANGNYQYAQGYWQPSPVAGTHQVTPQTQAQYPAYQGRNANAQPAYGVPAPTGNAVPQPAASYQQPYSVDASVQAHAQNAFGQAPQQPYSQVQQSAYSAPTQAPVYVQAPVNAAYGYTATGAAYGQYGTPTAYNVQQGASAAHAYTQPSQPYQQVAPAQAVQAYQQSYQPAQSYQQPAQQYQPPQQYQPAQSYQHAQAYQQPAQAYQQPAQPYQAPQAYQQPAQQYQAPQTYQQPAQAYRQPAQQYGACSPGMAACPQQAPSHAANPGPVQQSAAPQAQSPAAAPQPSPVSELAKSVGLVAQNEQAAPTALKSSTATTLEGPEPSPSIPATATTAPASNTVLQTASAPASKSSSNVIDGPAPREAVTADPAASTAPATQPALKPAPLANPPVPTPSPSLSSPEAPLPAEPASSDISGQAASAAPVANPGSGADPQGLPLEQLSLGDPEHPPPPSAPSNQHLESQASSAQPACPVPAPPRPVHAAAASAQPYSAGIPPVSHPQSSHHPAYTQPSATAASVQPYYAGDGLASRSQAYHAAAAPSLQAPQAAAQPAQPCQVGAAPVSQPPPAVHPILQRLLDGRAAVRQELWTFNLYKDTRVLEEQFGEFSDAAIVRKWLPYKITAIRTTDVAEKHAAEAAIAQVKAAEAEAQARFDQLVEQHTMLYVQRMAPLEEEYEQAWRNAGSQAGKAMADHHKALEHQHHFALIKEFSQSFTDHRNAATLYMSGGGRAATNIPPTPAFLAFAAERDAITAECSAAEARIHADLQAAEKALDEKERQASNGQYLVQAQCAAERCRLHAQMQAALRDAHVTKELRLAEAEARFEVAWEEGEKARVVDLMAELQRRPLDLNAKLEEAPQQAAPAQAPAAQAASPDDMDAFRAHLRVKAMARDMQMQAIGQMCNFGKYECMGIPRPVYQFY